MSEPNRLGEYCIFEYMYRDAGNWKTRGALLLAGNADGAREDLRECLEWGDLFVAEQVDVPSLCEEHFISCSDGPSDLDHAYHEFLDLRRATPEEVATLPVAKPLEDLMARFIAARGALRRPVVAQLRAIGFCARIDLPLVRTHRASRPVGRCARLQALAPR